MNVSDETKKEDYKTNRKDSFCRYWVLIILNVAAIFLSCASICCNITSISIENYNLIIGFIGVLATFIVVSNTVQVMKIEEDTQRKIEQFEKREEEYERKLENLKDLTNKRQFESDDMEVKVAVIMDSLNEFSQNGDNISKISVSSLQNLQSKVTEKKQNK